MAPYSSLPEVFTPQRGYDLEVAGSTEKQSAQPFAYGLPATPSDTLSTLPPINEPPVADDVHKKPSHRRKISILVCAVIAGLLVLGIALGVGLGIGLGSPEDNVVSTRSTGGHSDASNSSSNTQQDTESGADAGSPSVVGTHGAFSSTEGAFNGSSISVLASRFTNVSSPSQDELADESGNLLVFFQHYNGDIRWMQRTTEHGNWEGGSSNEVVATDAKKGSPISAMSTRPEGVRQWHVFYVDDNDMLRQRSIDNLTYTWQDGLLNGMNVKMLGEERAGLRACFYSGPIDGANLNGTTGLAGIRLFAATSETTFDQLAWRSGLSKWVWEQRWTNLNARATPACMGWARGSVTYAMFVNEQDAINVFWKDTGLGESSTTTHPINQWRNSGLAWHGGLYAKIAGRDIIQGWNLTLAAENSTSNVGSALSNVGGSIPAANTRLDMWSYPSGASVENTDEIIVFYQSEGTGITMTTGEVSTGAWSSDSLPVPDQ